MRSDNMTQLRQWARLCELSKVPALTESEAHEVAELATALDIRVKLQRVHLGDWPHVTYYEVGGQA